jgi:hypothetical protein
MSPPRLSRTLLQEALDVYAECDNNQAATARRLGINRSTFVNRLDQARRAGLVAIIKPVKPRIRVPARSVYTPVPSEFGKATRVFVFGCSHDSPSDTDKSRFRNAGRLASELRPDYIVELGDSGDLDSLSTHSAPGSVEDRQRPTFLTELQSLTEAYGLFHEAAPSPDEVPRYRCKGNHCHRTDRFEATYPTTEGLYTLPLSQVFARYGFTEKQFREWLFIEGVGFTHAPINAMGREMGGVNANQTVARETTFSVCWAHTHKREFVERPKIGIGNGIQVYNVGSFMPQGMIKQYAGLSQTGWSYGVSELTLRNGQIESARYWSELELRERYA